MGLGFPAFRLSSCAPTIICLEKGFTSSTACPFTPGFMRGLQPE